MQRDIAALCNSEDRFRLMVSSVKDYAILMLDGDGHIATWNAGAERFKGYRAEEIIGQHFSVFYPQEDIERGKPQMELEVATAEGRFEDEGWRVRKDGSKFFANVVITALRDEAGTLLGFGKVTRDITERKLAEQRLRDSEERFRLMVSSVKDYAILMLDAAGHIATWNAGAERFKGYRSEEIIGRHFSVFYPPEDIERDKPQMELQVAAAEGRFEDEGWRVRKDGSKFFANVVITALRDEAGVLRGFAKVTRDITDRKLAEKELLRLNHRLEQRVEHRTRELAAAKQAADAAKEAAEIANRAKTTFLATMSHEIRTPMNGMLGMLELLSLTELDPEQHHTVAVVSESGKSLLRIIDDILDFSKVEAGKLEVLPEVASMKDVVETVKNMYVGNASSKGLLLQQNVDPAISPALLFDSLRLRQILNNLVSNALKFTFDGSVQLRAELIEHTGTHDRLRFLIQDSGIGISPETQKELFQPYGQGRGASTRQYGGTGLGLTICRRLAELMGGTLEMRSESGKGTTMILTLSLPVADPQALKKTGPPQARSLTGVVGTTRRMAPSAIEAQQEGTLVLVVDDHPVNRMLLMRQIHLLGFAAESAEDGVQALDRWKSGRFGMILTDCGMPEMDGYDLARAIRRLEVTGNRKRIPIVACTASALEGEAEKCFQAGMDDYLVKPVALSQMAAKLDQWLPIPAAGSLLTP